MNITVYGKGDLAIDVCSYLLSTDNNLTVVPVIPEPTWAASLINSCKEYGVT